MKKTSLFFLLGFVISFVGCGNGEQINLPDEPLEPEIVDTTDTTTPITIDTSFVVVPLESHINQALPLTGLVLWVYKAKELNKQYNKSIALEFAYCLPCKVVKGKTNGKIEYDWSSFDDMLSDISSRNHQAVVRFRYEYPSGTDVDGVKGSTAVPAYIKELPDYRETYNSNAGGDGPTYYADWSNKELQWFTKQFYTDFCARYATDKRLAYLELGFGHWSEYHIYDTKLALGTNFPSKQYQEEFFLHIDSVANDLPWLVSIDAADDEYSPFTRSDKLMNLTFGLFDDSFMHEGHEIGSSDGYNEMNWNLIGQGSRWQKGVCGGEVSYYTDRDQREFLNPNGLYGITWEQAASKYHISFMIANDATEGYGTANRFLEASKTCGYRFEITNLRRNYNSVVLDIKNIGVAPIYRPAFIFCGNKKSDYNLMNLMPNSTKRLIFEIDKEEDIDIAIKSDFTLANIPFEANIH